MRLVYPTLATIAAVMFASAVFSPLQAQQSQQFGPYEVHYNTLNTNMLSPEIASAYGIQRAGTQAMLNITVLDRESREAVEADVEVVARNLTGQFRDIQLRQVSDQGAIYYIGQFRIHDEETLNFDVEVQPDGREGPPFELSFRQQFFTG
ncbi:MAG: DUF4426 domain-containing protein [Candidatus Wenzhouxiangella sp. M2_3B_020]